MCIRDRYGGAGAETDPMCSLPSYNSDPFAATDNCTPANLIEFRWELDANNDGSIDKKSGAKRTNFKSSEVSASGLPVGVHKLYVISEDNCSNEDTTYCLITVKDCKKPTPYCFNGIATVVMPTTQSVIVWAKDLDAGSYDNCTKRADLKLKMCIRDRFQNQRELKSGIAMQNTLVLLKERDHVNFSTKMKSHYHHHMHILQATDALRDCTTTV